MALDRVKRAEKRISIPEARFANLVFQGMDQKEAYLQAYEVDADDYSSRMLKYHSDKVLNSRVVKEYMKSLSSEIVKRSAMCFDMKREILAQLAMDEEVAARDRISAIKVDNDMVGDNAAKRTEVTTDVGDNLMSLMEKIRDGRGMINVTEVVDLDAMPKEVVDGSLERVEK